MWRKLAASNSSVARWWRRRNSRHVSNESPVIVGGCARTGTTLLRVSLDSHPNIACRPASSLLMGRFRPDNLADRFGMPIDEIYRLKRGAADHVQFADRFLGRYAAGRGKHRWAEKTPHNIRHLPWLLRHFPAARFIHMIRD